MNRPKFKQADLLLQDRENKTGFMGGTGLNVGRGSVVLCIATSQSSFDIESRQRSGSFNFRAQCSVAQGIA
jgi:hypothetical protein